MTKIWTLEVCRFGETKEGERTETSQCAPRIEHVGYMRAHFRTKKDAANYYDRHNPHMRNLNAHNTWRSDWDPNDHLLYIVREDFHINATIPPFDPNDEPIYDLDSQGYGSVQARFLS